MARHVLEGVPRTRNTVAAWIATMGAVALVVPAFGADEPGEGASTEGAGASVGLLVSPESLDVLGETPTDGVGPPVPVRLVARWAEVEIAPGRYDWSAVRASVERVEELGHEPILCLTGTHPMHAGAGARPAPFDGEGLEAWTAFVVSAWDAFAGRVSAFQIWDSPARPDPAGRWPAFDPGTYAFLLKSSSVALRARATADETSVRIVQGEIDPGRIEWLRAVLEEDSAPYIDVLPIDLPAAGSGSVPQRLDAVFTEVLAYPPAPRLWAYVETEAGAVEALAASAGSALLRLPDDGPSSARSAGWAVGLHAILVEGFAPAPLGSIAVEGSPGVPLPGGKALGRFLAGEDLVTVVVVDLADTGLEEGAHATLVVGAGDVRDVHWIDPIAGKRSRTASSRVAGGTAIRVPYRDYPVAVSFRRPVSAPGFVVAPEELEVATTRGLTAEEIIARHQEVQKEQDDRFERLMARGRVVFHYRLSQAGAGIDVAIESNYFWERGGELEWEQTDYFINGNRAPWKNFPKLPLIQPEKVMTLPLDLSLDRTYTYRLDGEGEVDGRPAYILAFRPADADSDRSLYRGRVWIDRQTFAKLRVSLVQNNLDPPVLSNEETDRYAPVEGPDGETYWLLKDVIGRQLWTVTGRSFVVERELTFTEFRINPPVEQFVSRRKEAYASKNQMLRDTREGFRYLEREDDGTRVVKEKIDSSQLFVAAGAFKDNSIDSVVPLAGVNYFNYDLWGKNLQTNVFFAGAFAFANITDPELFGGKMDAAAEAVLSALKGEDRIYSGDEEVLVQRVENRSQVVSGRVGVPLGSFFKLNVIGAVTFSSFYDNDDAQDAQQALGFDYVLPPDHEVFTGAVQLVYDRKGYSIQGQSSWSNRSEWAPWGLQDESTGEILNPDYDPAQKSFSRYSFTLSKQWFLPKFQKLRGSASFLDGSDLDRFSQYQFTFFGASRLNGFAGSGVRFDRGVLARAGYTFNVFEVIQFNLDLDWARVEDEASASGPQEHAGVGVSGNFVGPWKMIFAVSYGRALDSDIADLEGQQEFLLTIFKLF
jgi:hypothetical protein